MKWRLDKERVIVSSVVGLGLALIIFGFNSAETGRDAQKLPVAIENMNPGPGDQVLTQSQVFVDFIEGYEAKLTIDGVELETTRLDELASGASSLRPGAQVDVPPTALYDPGNFTISYQPQAGGAIEEFAQGTHTATVTYWKIAEGPGKAKSFTWTFETN